MVDHRSSPILLLVILAPAGFLVRTVWLMLGPLLVDLAAEFQTSVAVTGQLAAVIGLSWGITAPLVGPVSDTYGRRQVGLTGLLLMAVGTFGSVLAWSYGALLACRLLTGVGAAMIPPNSIAAIADHFPPAGAARRLACSSVSAFSAWSLAPPWSRSWRTSGGGGGRSMGWGPC